jgi:hypothetical protein
MNSKHTTKQEEIRKILTIEVVSAFSEDDLLRIAARDFALPSTKI